jgi:hypothetical protein
MSRDVTYLVSPRPYCAISHSIPLPSHRHSIIIDAIPYATNTAPVPLVSQWAVSFGTLHVWSDVQRRTHPIGPKRKRNHATLTSRNLGIYQASRSGWVRAM